MDQGRPDTGVCFVAGKEFYALAWVMAGASRAIAQTLQQIPDTSTAAVVIPDVPGLPPGRMYEVMLSPCVLTRTKHILKSRTQHRELHFLGWAGGGHRC